MKIDLFRGKYGFLSNFHDASIVYEDIKYPSTEYAFVASMVLDAEEKKKIAEMATASEAKRYGKQVAAEGRLRPGWHKMQVQIMRDIVWLKFSTHERLKKKLLDTGDAEIMEGNWWHDNFWGSCTCDRCKNKEKLNNLGIIIMDTRDRLRNM